MSSKNHKEVHGKTQPFANTAGMEQRSKFQNEFAKKKLKGDYPKQPNQRLGDFGGNTPSSMGTPSSTGGKKDPVIDTDSDDDISFSVVDTRKMAPVDDAINNTRMQMDDMVPYHKFSNRTDQQLREKHFALAKGYHQLVNELNHYKGRNSVQNSLVHTRLSRFFNFSSSLIRTSSSLS
jgi:hypothetical protein